MQDAQAPSSPIPQDYLLFLEGALCRDASGELVAAALEAILDTVAVDADGFRARCGAIVWG